MKIELVNRGTEGELIMDGRLDTNTAKEAEKIFLQMAERFDKLTLNLEHLQYVSSAGLRALQTGFLAMCRKGGKFQIKGVTPSVMEVFQITGFAGMITFI